MTQRWVEIVIGKLVTDRDLRRKFLGAPRETLLELMETGTHLTRGEIAALMATDSTLWQIVAARLDAASVNTTLKDE